MKILNTNHRTCRAEDGREVTFTAVLVEGVVGDYAVYVGVGSPEYVARCGDKVSFTEACCHFPIGL